MLRSRTPDGESGAEIEVSGGRPGEVVPCGAPVGTSVEVHNLFFNTPVRRKFLRTTQTEFGHTSEAFTRIALGSPEIHFTLRHNDRQVFELAGSEDRRERIERFFGRELAENLIDVESVDGDVRLAGYVPNRRTAGRTTACSTCSSTDAIFAIARSSTPWARRIGGC